MKTKEAQKHMKTVAKVDNKAFKLAQGFLLVDVDKEYEDLEMERPKAVGSKLTAILMTQNALLRLKSKFLSHK